MRITFQNREGFNLEAWLDQPTGQPIAYALFAHCFTCSKNILAAAAVSEALKERGIATLRFDFTGLGESSGDFADTNFSSQVDDLISAAELLRAQFRAPTILIGHSLGGTAALSAASRIPEIVGVVTIGAPFDPEHVRHLLGSAEEQISTLGIAQVSLAGRTFTVKRQFLEDISAQNIQGHLSSLRKALLIFHSPADDLVDIENAKLIFEAANHPKSFVALDGMDHFVKRRSDGRYVANLIAAWVKLYL